MRTLSLTVAFLAASWTLPAVAQTPQPLTGVVKVAVGISHACALTQAGGVICWGNNGGGQLGIGSTEQRHTPVDVPSLRSGVVDIAAGQGSFTCALTAAGDVKCWGANGTGQLGDGTTTQRFLPVQTLSGATSISAGAGGACAVTTSGQVKCWGANNVGQVGDGSTTQRNSPTDVSGLTDAVQVSVGGGHACAVTTAGGVKCWGGNASGQLGDNSTTSPRLTAVDVSGLASGVAFVDAGGNHSCALRTNNTVACWGQGTLGQIGDGNASTANRLTPVNVTGGLTFSKMRAGSATTCAVTTAGAAVCWGQGSLGGLGNGTVTNAISPAAVTDLGSGVTFIDANGNTGCAISGASGALSCWGSNSNGQLGTNDFNRVPTPTPIAGGLAFKQVSAGAAHACGLTMAGAVYCWGTGLQGAIGDGTTNLREVPTPVTGLGSGVSSISVYANHSCALTDAGGVKCWGTATVGIGDGSSQRFTPTDVTGLTSGVSVMAAGGNHNCAIVSGAIKCWGSNSSGQVGDTTTTNRPTPVDVAGVAGVTFVDLALGENHSCARDSNDRMWCWGANSFGQLGIGSTSPSATPVQLALPGVIKMGAGSNHTCAVTGVSTLNCWGSGTALGNNSTGNQTSPVAAFGTGLQVDAVTSGGIDFTCAHLTDNSLRCTGRNTLGQLGNNTVTTNTLTPVVVDGGPWASVSAGNDFACAITLANVGYCWGFTDRAQTGTGLVGYSAVPLAVVMFDTAPESFAFDAQVDVPLNNTRTSTTVTVTGIDPGTLISITGGSYSIGCTASFTSTPGSINPGATLCVRHISALTLSAVTTTRVVIGNFEALFTSTTVPTWLLNVSRSGPGTNTVTSDPAGINCGATCSAPFLPGVPITLTAVASSTTRHTGWTGGSCDAVGAAPCVVTLAANTSVTAVFIAKTSQSITFNAPASRPITDPPFTVSATASSGLAVVFSSLTLPVCTVADGVVTLVAAGTCTIRASQPGDGTFLPASNLDRSFSITKIAQAITFDALANRPITDAPFAVSATASSGLPVAFSSLSIGACTVANGQVTLVAAGFCTIRASQPGDGTFLGAPNVDRGFLVSKVAQTISFGQLPDRLITESPVSLSATASSGLTVAFASTTTPVCNATNGQVTLTAPGLCTIRATQPGDGTYLAAPAIDRSFTVSADVATLFVAVSGYAGPGTGTGSVTSNPAGIDCGADCSETYAQGTVVTLVAHPAPDSMFQAWSVPACGASLECTVTMNTSLSVQAQFVARTPARPRADFDNDGKADLVFRNADGRVAVWLMDGLSVLDNTEVFPAGTAWQVAHIADLDGDGKADLVWQNPDGRITVYLMDGTTATLKQNLLPAGGGWTVTQAADLDGDNKADLVFQNIDGTIAAYLMDGGVVRSGLTLIGPESGWNITKVGDFDGDGKSDVVWTHVDGRVAIWLMDGLTVKSTNQILNAATGWSVAHVTDLDGDGKADLVWQNVDGTVAAWLMNGASMTSGLGLLGPGTGWSVTHTGDFDNDGKADLLWTNSDGRVAIWLMDGLTVKSSQQILDGGSGWIVKRVQDLDGDGKADIVWQNFDGRVAAWLMNGTAMTSGGEILEPGTGWSVSGVSP